MAPGKTLLGDRAVPSEGTGGATISVLARHGETKGIPHLEFWNSGVRPLSRSPPIPLVSSEILGRFTDNLVTNDTGLAGEYDFTLEWAQDQNTDAVGPSLFTAIPEQLGLRLVPMTKPVEVIVIDHIERPSDN